MLTLLVGILSLGILVLVHEVGHLLVARRMRVRVLKFSIGFGPRIAGFRKGETEYVVSAIPFGGFVKMAGEEEPTGAPGELRSKPWWVRSLVALGGPAANVVFAFVLFTVTAIVGIRVLDGPSLIGRVDEDSAAERIGFRSGDRVMAIGSNEVSSWFEVSEAWGAATSRSWDQVPVLVARGDSLREIPVHSGENERWLSDLQGGFPPVVGEAQMGMPAYRAGLQRGDTVLAIDGRRLASFDEMRELVLASPESALLFTIKRGGKVRDVEVIPISTEVLGVGLGGMIGVLPMEASTRLLRLGPLDALAHGAVSTAAMTGAMYVGLYRIISRPIMFKEHLSGPIAIAQMSAAQARRGLSSLVHFVAFISIALAVMNLLPIPVLDGGLVLFCLVEALRGRPLRARSEMLLQRIGITFLVAVMAFAVINDTSRAISRRRALARVTDTGSAAQE